jgi:hypothetical protein
VAQALARQATIEADSYATLSALYVSRRQLVVLNMTRTLLIGAVGAVGGAVLAFALSPLSPVGEARLADPSLGFVFDAPVFLLGAMVAIVAVLALGLWPAVRTARARPPEGGGRAVRPSQIVAFLAAAGAPPSALIGTRHALERGRSRTAVPVGPAALLGSVLAVTALCGTAVFGTSLTHLTSTPALYGQPFDEWFGVNGTGSPAQNNQMLTSIERDHAISDITAGIGGAISINGRNVSALAGEILRGQVLITTTSGRLPIVDDEVTMGEATLRQVGARVGSVVRVTSPTPQGGTRTSSFRVVGTAVFPPDFGAGGLGLGAVFTLGAFLGGRCAAGPQQKACLVQTMIRAEEGSFLVRAVPGPEGRATLGRLARAFPGEVEFPAPPTNLVNFGEAVNFPLIFGLVLIIFGAATLVHLLVVSVVRRREEMGLLKAIGFVRRQVAFCVSWQTTTVALAGIVLGVPFGIALGQLVWRAFARNLGVLPVAVVTAWAIVAIALGTLIVANALAIGPALVASRSRPASLLRAE